MTTICLGENSIDSTNSLLPGAPGVGVQPEDIVEDERKITNRHTHTVVRLAAMLSATANHVV